MILRGQRDERDVNEADGPQMAYAVNCMAWRLFTALHGALCRLGHTSYTSGQYRSVKVC